MCLLEADWPDIMTEIKKKKMRLILNCRYWHWFSNEQDHLTIYKFIDHII